MKTFKTSIVIAATSLLLTASNLHAQNIFPANGAAGVGTTSPNASSLLDIASTTKGMLTPRMTQVQRDAIASPATGLLIFQTDKTPGLYYYTGTAWKAVAQRGWSLTGNGGINASINFLGTTDNSPLVFKVNDTKSGIIESLHDNTALGYLSFSSNNTGQYNTAMGTASLWHNTSGDNNSAFGNDALSYNTTGTYNTGVGNDALYDIADGSDNTALGAETLLDNKSGSRNTAVGESAGGRTEGNNNTNLGYQAGPTIAGLINATGIGYNVTPTASNQVRIGNASVTSIGGQVGWTIFSDGRYKKNIKENVPGLAFINQLKPVTYTLDINGIREFKGESKKDVAGEKNENALQEKMIHTGFVAQDVEVIAKKMNYDFDGVDAPKNDKDLYGIRYDEFVVPLVKAVQELSKSNDEKDKKLEDLQRQIDELKKMIQPSAENSVVSQAATTNLTIASALLEQNIPNPFTANTTIHYSLPQKFTTAQILITDQNGKALKQLNVSGTGKGSLNIDTAMLSAGAYNYSMYVDGKLIGSKQMVHIK